MKTQTKHILLALGIGAGVFVLYEMYKAVNAGVTAIGDVLMAPFNAARAVWNGVSSAASSVTSTVANVAAGNAAEAQLNAMNNSDYAPGGTIYNEIAASQGPAAANQAWQTVQNNQATQASQDVTWNPLSWI
ncbi:MAG TPA: hypothetical protein VH280_14895 [Verrucomicrobiae bacterium]|jgi:hypothetical protein|nr:hypothetical protein [Verrucomicrobiae bacterium]